MLVCAIIGAGVTIGSQVEKVRSDFHEQSRVVNQRLCRIEFAVGLVPSKNCDVSEFLVSPDDSKVNPIHRGF